MPTCDVFGRTLGVNVEVDCYLGGCAVDIRGEVGGGTNTVKDSEQLLNADGIRSVEHGVADTDADDTSEDTMLHVHDRIDDSSPPDAVDCTVRILDDIFDLDHGVVDDTGAGRLLLLLHDALRIANCCLSHQ